MSNSLIEFERKNMTNLNDFVEEKIRFLLDDFLQDIDTENKIDANLANAIIDVHLKKFRSFSQQLIEKTISEIKTRMPKEKRGSGDAEENPVGFGNVMGYNQALSDVQTILDSLLESKGISIPDNDIDYGNEDTEGA
jgi:hypothetical protein